MSETQTLLHLADDVVEALRFGRSVLLQAALQGQADVLRYQLLRIIIISSSSDLPPASLDQPELVKALSEALLGAAEQGHAHCLSALLESAAPHLSIDGLLNTRNKLGETALTLIAKQGRGDCVKILLQYSPEAQVAAANKRGRTALIWAAHFGHAKVVGQLLQHSFGAQVAATDKSGSTALITAASRGNAAVVSQLLQHSPGAQVAAVTEHGDSALVLAAYRGHAAIVSQLLQHSPEVQVVAQSSSGATALLAAVVNNHPDCAALLLAHSPSAQLAIMGGGESAVEVAARRGHPQCLDLLLAHSPQQQHLDAAWLSALRRWDTAHARTSPHSECLERLLAKGAVLPNSPQEADKAKHRLFIQDWGTRALAPARANEAMVGLAVSARGKKRKAGLREEQ